ncbi:Uncharacterised protein [uncultured archaeon]|nr:Uncharacterised protein [uncultured archaeon]
MIAKHEVKSCVWTVLNNRFTPNEGIHDISELTVERLHKIFEKEDAKVTKQEIKDALEQLVEDGSVKKKWISFDIYYPKDKTHLLPSNMDPFFSIPSVLQIIWAYYMFFAVTLIPPINKWLNTIYLKNMWQVIAFSLMLSVLSVYISSSFFSLLKKYIPQLDVLFSTISKEVKQMPPFLLKTSINFLYLIFFPYLPILVILGTKPEVSHLLTILGISVSAAIAYKGKEKLKLESENKNSFAPSENA